MIIHPTRHSPHQRLARFFLLTCLAGALALPAFAEAPAKSQTTAPALEKAVPETVEDLRAIQQEVKRVLDKVMPCIVGVRIGAGQGSGVIISEDGYVLTAGHVAGSPNSTATIILPNGRQLKGKTLGINRAIDSGLVKITDKGKWPFVPMGKSADLTRGQWCIAVGHPGGYQSSRSPVVRLGRILDVSDSALQTTCTLVGGDSGGPLFDFQGKVIGIHSRIGNPITANIHVPVDTFHDTWERLVKGDSWGGRLGGRGEDPFLGVQGDPDAKECRLLHIVPGSPAEKAGLKENDVITRFGKRTIETYGDLVTQVGRRQPGDTVTLEVQRGDEVMRFRVVIGKRES